MKTPGTVNSRNIKNSGLLADTVSMARKVSALMVALYCMLGVIVAAEALAVTPSIGWNVDCGNYCYFSEFPHNCQGVYWKETLSSVNSYSSWSDTYSACEESDFLTGTFHIISPSLISCSCPTPSVTPPADQSATISSTTRTSLELLRAQIQSWTPCAPDPAASHPNLILPISYKDLDTCQHLRKTGKPSEFIAVGSGCYSGLSANPDPTWMECNYSGDEVSNMAMNCLSGDRDRCANIKDAQDPLTGGWYRNAYLRRHPEATRQNTFSRDGLMGLLAYVTATNDKEALRKWITFVKNNGPKISGGVFFNACPIRPDPKPSTITTAQWDSMIPDDRCNMLPESWGQVYFAAQAVGLTNAELNAISTEIYSAMASGSLTLDSTIYSEAATAPAIGAAAYQAGDTMDAIFSRMHTPGGVNSTTVGAASTINDRTSRLNPYYHYLAHSETPTEYGAYLIKKYCKNIRPLWGEWFNSGFAGDSDGNWAAVYWNAGSPLHVSDYQYAGGYNPYGTKSVPAGSECLGLLNLYLGNSNLTELQCMGTDALINGACEKFAFAQPKLAPIYGIDYLVRTSDAKITYAATDRLTCPYGGSLESGTVRCALSSGLSTSAFHAGTTYWVDPDQRWPGIYYSDGTTNHSITSYAAPTLYPGITYWVDSNPSWPGVYYAKISGGCPHGGDGSGANCRLQAFASGFLDTTKSYFVRANPAHPGVYYYPAVIPEIPYGGRPILNLNNASEMKASTAIRRGP